MKMIEIKLEERVMGLLNKPLSKEDIERLSQENQAKIIPYDNNCRKIHYLKLTKDGSEVYFHLRRDSHYYLVMNGVF